MQLFMQAEMVSGRRCCSEELPDGLGNVPKLAKMHPCHTGGRS